jgi:sugar lactone lactonase YvrE
MRFPAARSLLFVLLLSAASAGAHPGAAISVTADGRVFFVDTGGGIYSVERDRRLVRHEGPAFHWFAADLQGRFRRTQWPSIPGGELRAIGVNPTLILSSDVPVTIGTDGRFYFPERGRDGRVHIVGVDAGGARAVRAVLPPVLSGGQPAVWLNGLAAGPNGSLYYTEDRIVRKVDAQGRVSIVAANVTVANCTAIPGIEPGYRPYLRGLAVARDGSVYVAASGCGALLKIDAAGRTRTILRTAAPWSPTAVTIAGDDVYVLEYLHTASDDRREWLARVRKIAPNGTATILATTSR